MNGDQLLYFNYAYQTHNFSAAAKLVPMSTQGFVKSLRSLEAELGVPLFTQDERGLHTPTSYADELALFAKVVEGHMQDMQRSFRQIKALEEGRVKLGSSLGIIGMLGGEFLLGFRRKYPNVLLDYVEMSDNRCDNELATGECALAFTVAPYSTCFDTAELYSTPMCLWVNKNDPLSIKEVIDPFDLDGRPIAMPGSDYKCNVQILERCAVVGARPRCVLESSEMFWLYNFAYQGQGIAFSAGHLGKLPFFSENQVACIPLADMKWSFGLSVLPQRTLSDAETLFYEYCLDWFNVQR